MLFWIMAASLTAIATLAALWPLLGRRGAAGASREQHDVEVYSAQLRELAGDVERGALPPEEAEVARAEVGRRLLRAAQAAEAAGRASAAPGRNRRLLAAACVLLLLPLSAAALYGRFGSPGTADLPLAARSAGEGGSELASLVARAEARLAENPEDGLGWEVLAPIYLRLGRSEDAATAFGNALRLLGTSAARQAGLGEALTRLAGGEVTDEAEAAFRQALAADAGYLPAKFFLALDLSQEGRSAEALQAWEQLVAESPANAPWLPVAQAAAAEERGRISAVGGGGAGPLPNPRDLGSEEIAAAAALPAEERGAMVEAMVAQLAARLRQSPADLEGWKRLMRSYAVLGRAAEAENALKSALSAFPEGSGERREIAAFADGLGLRGETETQ